jgi:hypothetical protein
MDGVLWGDWESSGCIAPDFLVRSIVPTIHFFVGPTGG